MRKEHRTIRAFLATLLIVLGAISVSFSLVSHWLNTQIVNSDKFTDIYEDLPTNPLFQEVIAANVSTFVEEQVSDSAAGALTSDVLGGISGLLDHIPGASSWAESVGGVPQELLDSLSQTVRSEVINMMNSPAFKPVWRTSVHEVHAQLIGSLEGQRAAVYVDNEPYLALETGPLISALKQTLAEDGAWYARFIPEVTGTIPVVQIHDLAQLQSWFGLLEPADTYLPYVAGLLLVLGVVVAPRRFLAVGLSGIAVAVTSGIIVFGTPGAAGKYFSAMGDADRQLLSQELWDMATRELIVSAQTTMWIAIGATALGLVAAIIAAATAKRNRHSQVATYPRG